MTYWLDTVRDEARAAATRAERPMALVLGDPAGRAAATCEAAGLRVVRMAVPHGTSVRRFERDPGDLVVRGSADALPFASGVFDLVVLHATLEFSHDDREVARECGRVLRPGGVVVARVPRRGALDAVDALNLLRYTRELSGRGHIAAEALPIGWRRHYTRDDLDAVFPAAGLRVESLTSGGLALGEAAYAPALVWSRIVRPDQRLQQRLRGLYARYGDLDERLPGVSAWVVTAQTR